MTDRQKSLLQDAIRAIENKEVTLCQRLTDGKNCCALGYLAVRAGADPASFALFDSDESADGFSTHDAEILVNKVYGISLEDTAELVELNDTCWDSARNSVVADFLKKMLYGI